MRSTRDLYNLDCVPNGFIMLFTVVADVEATPATQSMAANMHPALQQLMLGRVHLQPLDFRAG